MKDYLTAADTAKLVRKALAKAFPDVKFYVRSDTYAGGASIDVYYDGRPDTGGLYTRVDSTDKPYGDPVTYDKVDYRDGRWAPILNDGMPTTKAVDAVVSGFAGGGFDGMIDMAYSKDVYLDADGNVVGGASLGTVGSHGMDPAYDTGLPPGARVVRPLADHVFVNDTLPYDVRVKGKKP